MEIAVAIVCMVTIFACGYLQRMTHEPIRPNPEFTPHEPRLLPPGDD